MGNFSRDPDEVLAANLAKGYVGVRIEQNVPLLDRDVNLLGDLVGASLRKIIQGYVGDGVAPGDDGSFQITAANPQGTNFQIGAGTMLVGGLQARTGLTSYAAQAGAPPLTSPPVGQVRVDVVYLDVWLQEVATDADPAIDLGNLADIGIATSVRLQPAWRVEVAEGTDEVPPAAEGHARCPLALVTRDGPTVVQLEDLRVRRLNLADLVQRVEALEADIAVVKTALQPSFSPTRPFDKPSSYPTRTVVLYGKNFDLGSVGVKIGNFALPIVGQPLANAITVRILETAPKGDVAFTVTTALGAVTSPVHRIFGAAAIQIANPFSPNPVPSGQSFTITGTFLDAPNVEVQVQPWNGGTWSALSVSGPTPTTIAAVAPGAGQYKVRVRSEVSPTWFTSNIMLTVS
ncbi:hypothetical protein SAMN02745121_06888 [Nannocystis exedens]|uniref:IPT/TIG domain-containing protein n=1 Tax=Nannocystis exedens TaxID=54 RepID=A0A1I2FWU2_9BACT|nr:hypothetical protein [Nannocystis exedens]PCC73771.1 Mucin-5AC [Nannocystis exedens]SFF09268.1 hypothetical protein SAMN02745121_06888 [Nannocystis exedens]